MTSKYVSEAAGVVFFVALCVVALIIAGFLDASAPLVSTLASIRLVLAISLGMIAVILMLLARWIRGVLALLIALATFGQVYYFAHQHALQAPDAASTLKVISFNILGQNTENGERIASFLAAEQPDIVFIQEAYPLLPYLETLEDILPYRIGCTAQARCDLMFLSRYPLRDITRGDLSEFSTDRLFTATAEIGGTEVQFVAPHLTKPYFGGLQTREFNRLIRTVNASTGPLIMAGDFNSAAWAPGFARMLDETRLGLAAREPATWPVIAGPLGVPIDHVLVRAPLGIASINPLPESFGSNHLGLVAKITLPDANR